MIIAYYISRQVFYSIPDEKNYINKSMAAL